jgi:GTP-binding protein EngB required for normal cell division
VKTYLYCSRKNRTISVKGVNQKNVLVNLNPGVLQAIQHAKESNIYLASVLDKLFVEIPSQELDGLVFIDTPGYNNTEKANQSNGKTDRETALEALGEGNVLFWLVDCERGTTVTNDIEIIKQFNGKKVFIFNKADKKGYQESVKIVEEAAKVLYKEFPEEEIIDIIAYSTLDNKIYCSKNNMTLNTIVNEAKKSGNGISEMNLLKDFIAMLFDDEISASQNAIKNIEENYKEKQSRKNETQEMYRNAKEFQNNIVSTIRKILINNYNEVLQAVNKYCDSSCNACNTMGEFINAMYEWDATDHECWNNTLIPIINRYNNRHDSLCNTHNAINYTWYEEEFRRDVVKSINEEEDFVVSRFKEFYEDACSECENALDGINREQILIKDMQEYRRVFMSALETGIRLYQQQNQATSVHNDENIVPNIFDCIKKDDYKLFLHSFEDGVDLSVCNVDG